MNLRPPAPKAWVQFINPYFNNTYGDARCTHSIEFDFGKKWAEAIGQALYYSSKTGKQAGIFLIIAENNDWNNLEKIKRVIKEKGMDVKVWTISPEDLNK